MIVPAPLPPRRALGAAVMRLQLALAGARRPQTARSGSYWSTPRWATSASCGRTLPWASNRSPPCLSSPGQRGQPGG